MMLLRCVRRRANFSSIIVMILLTIAWLRCHANPRGRFHSCGFAARRAFGVVVQRGHRLKHIIDGDQAARACHSLSAGFDATAAASDAQDARMARFSPSDIVWSATTSRGWS